MSVPTQPATAWPERVTLRDGSTVLVRPIRPEDRERLALGFERLSRRSRARRFLQPVSRLSPDLLRRLTEVDHHDHEALVAEAEDGEGVGVARFIRLPENPAAAEVTVVVADRWQNRGAATELLRRLAVRAAEEGVERFVATCLAGNRQVFALLEGVEAKRVQESDDGLVEIEIELAAQDGPMREALRRAAEGALSFRHPFGRLLQ
jgi:RimJ/RimL family protein N-acetyltransferase